MFRRIGNHRIKKVIQVLVRRVLGHHNYTGIGTDSTKEAHLVGCHAGIGVLSQTCCGRGRGGNNQVVVTIALVHNMGVGETTAAASHVGDLNGAVIGIDVGHNFGDGPAGKVPPTPGVRWCNTLSSKRLCAETGTEGGGKRQF